MKTAKTLSITIPPEMLARAEALAKKENRTMSELIREALRHYERQRWWEETNAYGSARAAAVGVRGEDDLIRAVHAHRDEQRPPRKKRLA